ncbi:MAG: tyrosine-type recombinase/integrase [Lachnospiraceae bacterium]|nr:tyrosine-type recombinase/integrase [Lachnospiraceae bacterium]
MGEAARILNEGFDNKYNQMVEYLEADGRYWIDNDQWSLEAEAFRQAGINTGKETEGNLVDFSTFPERNLKTEMKYFLLYSMRNKLLTAGNVLRHYRDTVREIGQKREGNELPDSFAGLKVEASTDTQKGKERSRLYGILIRDAVRFFEDYYDDREETEKDVWHASRLTGIKISAAARRTKSSMNFTEIAGYYRPMVKRFMKRLIVKRSWSYCTELLIYIRYFFKIFYSNGYGDGFLAALTRADVENYLGWVAVDYGSKNATFRSKAVSFIRQFIDYIQLAEYPEAPEKDVNRLIFDDDIPRRERAEDTMSKIKYIPEPVREQIDASINEIEPKEMQPVYILLRETGWRGTDVLNLRYDSCLEYIWNKKEKTYVPYLCGEITKTGIPLLKIPVRDEVADMIKKLSEEAASISTEENNPDKYLFNTYDGKCKGLPYSKPAFTSAVQELIVKKEIKDGDGNIYHFRAHSLRHTRAMEYTEQGMPIGIIQQILGHCSIQMTLHYAKVSEDMLFQKWKETEKLGLLHLESTPPDGEEHPGEDIRYEYVRKNLDAVKVPFGVCFKPSKLPCRQQMSHCLKCANFCTGKDDIPEYEAEIRRVKVQLEQSKALGRGEWIEKNQKYLDTLEKMLARIRKEGLIHKNGSRREEYDG